MSKDSTQGAHLFQLLKHQGLVRAIRESGDIKLLGGGRKDTELPFDTLMRESTEEQFKFSDDQMKFAHIVSIKKTYTSNYFRLKKVQILEVLPPIRYCELDKWQTESIIWMIPPSATLSFTDATFWTDPMNIIGYQAELVWCMIGFASNYTWRWKL